MNVIKRDGRIVQFDKEKIKNAIAKAFMEVDGELTTYAKEKARDVALLIEKLDNDMSVEDIQDFIEEKLMASQRKDVAKAYIIYRENRSKVRQFKTPLITNTIGLLNNTNDYLKGENSNKDSVLATTQRDYMAGIVSTEMTKSYLLPDDIVEAHNEGIIHFHDADYFAQPIYNCCLVNGEDMLQNNTVISNTLIEKPHSFSTACTITTQIIAQVASSQYGGQSISLAHLAPFVDISRNKIKRQVEKDFAGIKVEDDWIEHVVEEHLKDEIKKGIQTIQYQVITLMTTNGQAPFLTIYLDLGEAKNEREKKDLALLIEEVLKQRYQGIKNEKDVWVSPSFPKLIYALYDENVKKDGEYRYLTELAAKCTANRMVPDYLSTKVMKHLKGGDVYPCMGCRSFLTPDRFTDAGLGNIANAKNYVEGKHKYYGRFNQGVVTLNLVDLALSSGKDMDKFWEIFEERTELCHRALRCRHERLLGTSADVAPILWRHGAIARLEQGEKIDKLLYNGYSTISLGYAGLYECVKYMTGRSHSDEGIGEEFGLQVMQRLNDQCNKWKAAENIDYSLYGTPLESTTEKFAKSLKRRFGDDVFVRIDGFDRLYVTNSYHIPVFEEINPFKKLKLEAKFQEKSPGGAISYIETADMRGNVDAILEVIEFIYENIQYAEFNTKSDYCHECGYDKEIELVEQDGKYVWRCPNCGNQDTRKMNVSRRTCGYIGEATNGWNQGRLGDIHDRYVHLADVTAKIME